MPLLKHGGEFAGVVLFTIKVSNLLGGFFGKQTTEDTFFVIDSKNNILYHPAITPCTYPENIDGADPTFIDFVKSIMPGVPLSGKYISLNGEESLASAYPFAIGNENWYVVVETSEDKLKDLLSHFSNESISIIVLMLISVITASFVLANTNVRLHEEAMERKAAEDEHKRSDELFRGLFNMASDCIILLEYSDTGETIMKDVNIATCKLHGYTREELIGNPISMLDAPGSKVRVPELVRKIDRGEAFKFEIGHLRKDGTEFPVEVSARKIEIQGKPHILAIDRDITERKLAEEALRKAYDELESRVEQRTADLKDLNTRLQEEIRERSLAEKKLIVQHGFLNSLLESLTHPFYVINASDYKVVMANTASGFGSLAEGRTCYELTHNTSRPCSGDEHPCTLKAVVSSRKPVILEHVHYDSENNPRIFEVHGYPIFDSNGEVSEIIEYTLDITARRKSEDALRKAKHLESIGRLAAGIAHEINNPLTNASLNMQILFKKLESVSADASLIQKLESLGHNIDRASEIASGLLQFSHMKAEGLRRAALTEIDVNSTIKTALDLSAFNLSRIEVKLDLAGDLPDVGGDPMKLEQVMINLIANASEAMPEGGDVHISTELRDGKVVIRVRDTGTGIQEEHIENIVDPLYSTKEVGDGVGLGLSISYGLVNDLNGTIEVSSSRGKGSTVTIILPSMVK